ncbi:MAG: hypothetical protein V4589_05570 [Bacteroidota bacterium]
MSSQVSDTSVDNDTVSSDMLVNNLVYRVGSALSLVTERTGVRYFPQQQQIPSASLTTSTWDLNSGVSYANLCNSYLAFDLSLVSSDSTSTANFGSGSAMNIIRSVILKSRSGTELCRADNANVWSRNYHVNMLSAQYLRREGLIEGWDVLEDGSASTTARVYASQSATGNRRFVLPLARLAPFFNSYKKGQKLPSAILSGMHMEIVFEDHRTAFLGLGTSTQYNGISNYNVSNLSIMIDCLTLTDDTQRALNTEAAEGGLEIVSNQYYVSRMVSPSGETELNMQIRKSVSQAESVSLVILNTSNLLVINADSFAGFAGDATSHNWRLGSLYFPKTPITNTETQQQENYFLTLQTYNKNDMLFEESGVSYTTYANGPYYSLNVCMEKDSGLNYSGLPCNNSRSIESLITFENDDRARTCYAFLNYVSVIRTFIDNVSVAI